MLAATRALPQRLRRCMQVKYGTVLLETFAIGGSEHRAAAGGQDGVDVLHALRNHGLFPIAQTGLAFKLENDRDRYAEPRLELDVRIVKALVEPLGEQSTERRLATTRHADQK